MKNSILAQDKNHQINQPSNIKKDRMSDRFIITNKKTQCFQQNICHTEQFSVATCLKHLIRSQEEKTRSTKKMAAVKNQKNLTLRQNDQNKFGLDFSRVQENPVTNTKPFRILQALTLTDNHQSHLLDCSFSGMVSVGLSKGVYLWNKKGQILRIRQQPGIWSLKWSPLHPNILACGSDQGGVEVWDVQKQKMLDYFGNRNRGGINNLTWNGNTLFSGAQNGSIYEQDLRQQIVEKKVPGFNRQQILTIKFQPNNNQYLACSTMDGRLRIWDSRTRKIKYKLVENKLQSICPTQSQIERNVIRGIDWHPSNHNLLAYGDNSAQNGTSANRSNLIKLVNISQNGQPLKTIRNQSQICSLCYSCDGGVLYSSHGPTKNQVYGWNCLKSYKKQTIFKEHQSRILYIGLNESEKRECLISGAGDQAIKFWEIPTHFTNTKYKREEELLPSKGQIR